MSKKRVIRIVLTVVAAVVVVAVCAWAFSYSIALSRADMSTGHIELIDQDFDANGDLFRVVRDTSGEGDAARIAHLTRGAFGIWHLSYQASGFTTWGLPAVWHKTSTDNALEIQWENHYVYCGNNAKAKVEFKPGQIPNGVAVSIKQDGGSYEVHLVAFAAGGENIFGFVSDVPRFLAENGCVG
ncbi:hypothetical protein FACS1894202_08110 [Clostridia bacterium]|nr:hypothetical protein FACS1894202_08110 [Clostridia bacterium]